MNGKRGAVVVAALVLAFPAGASAHTISVSRAKLELLSLIREDYTPRRGMGWACYYRSAHWIGCGIAWRNEGGSRYFCAYGSVRYREGTLITTYRLVRCHP